MKQLLSLAWHCYTSFLKYRVHFATFPNLCNNFHVFASWTAGTGRNFAYHLMARLEFKPTSIKLQQPGTTQWQNLLLVMELVYSILA